MFAKVKEAIDIVEYVSKFVDLKETSGGFTGLCPLHEEDTPSFRVYPDSQTFWCYGCSSGRDVIDFEAQRSGREEIEALKYLAEIYGVKLNEEQKTGYTDQTGKRFMAERMTEVLFKNEEMIQYLNDRGINEETIRQWQIGLTFEGLFVECKERFKNDKGMTDFQFLFDIGVANKKKGDFWNYMKPGRLCYPVRLGRNISHFHYKSIDGSKGYQALNEQRGDALFYNQDAMKEDEFWLVEGPEDTIQMKLQGYPTAGTFGSMSKAQIQYIRNLCKFNDTFDELTEDKIIHILFDRDKNRAGQKRAVRNSSELCHYHKVFVHALEEGEDPDSFIRKGGNVASIKGTLITKKKGPIHIKDGIYIYQSSEQGKTRILSDFTMEVEFQIEDLEGWKSYMVKLKKDGITTKLYEISSKNWKTETAFREWLGKCGNYNIYTANRNDVYDLVGYVFEISRIKTMKLIDGYGEIESGLWVWDNAAILDGREHKADKDNIIWLPGRNTDGIRTTTCNELLRVELPEDCDDLETIISNLCKYWQMPRLVWLMLGEACASIFFRPITAWMHCFVVCFAHGPTERGKTFWAKVLTSLCGGADIKTPSGDSTAIGLRRHLSRTFSIPVVSNEFKGAVNENIIRSLFDLDPHIMGIKSMDKRTLDTAYHSSGIMTAKYAPREKDVINRCIMVDFHNFHQKKGKEYKKEFNEYYANKRRNAGFIKAVLNSGAEKNVIREINNMKSFIIDGIPDIESRQLDCYSVIFGSLYAVGKALKLREIFEKCNFASPNPDNLIGILKELHYGTEDIMKGSEEMTTFFELTAHLMTQGRLDGMAIIGQDTQKRKDYLRIHLPSVLQEVKKEEARSGVYMKKLAERSSNDISRTLKVTLGVSTATLTTINGVSKRHHTIYLDDINRVFGCDFNS